MSMEPDKLLANAPSHNQTPYLRPIADLIRCARQATLGASAEKWFVPEL
jgi:hypothetical protein